VSRQPKKRLASLQTAHFDKLHLLGVIDGDCEKELHEKFKNFRRSGEWFTLSVELVEYIQSCVKLHSTVAQRLKLAVQATLDTRPPAVTVLDTFDHIWHRSDYSIEDDDFVDCVRDAFYRIWEHLDITDRADGDCGCSSADMDVFDSDCPCRDCFWAHAMNIFVDSNIIKAFAYELGEIIRIYIILYPITTSARANSLQLLCDAAWYLDEVGVSWIRASASFKGERDGAYEFDLFRVHGGRVVDDEAVKIETLSDPRRLS